VRAVRHEPSPAALLSGWTAGVSEVSRFSCLKFLGVSGVFDYAGPKQELALALLLMLPSAHYKGVGVRIYSFRSWITHPAYPPVYASPSTSRCPVQNSGPSGSLALSRKDSSSSASCRFTPAHCNRLIYKGECQENISPQTGSVELLLDFQPPCER
jgi:hypothetical protein